VGSGWFSLTYGAYCECVYIVQRDTDGSTHQPGRRRQRRHADTSLTTTLIDNNTIRWYQFISVLNLRPVNEIKIKFALNGGWAGVNDLPPEASWVPGHLATKFQRLHLCFRGQRSQRNYKRHRQTSPDTGNELGGRHTVFARHDCDTSGVPVSATILENDVIWCCPILAQQLCCLAAKIPSIKIKKFMFNDVSSAENH